MQHILKYENTNERERKEKKEKAVVFLVCNHLIAEAGNIGKTDDEERRAK